VWRRKNEIEIDRWKLLWERERKKERKKETERNKERETERKKERERESHLGSLRPSLWWVTHASCV
jgi:hypothetical protein